MAALWRGAQNQVPRAMTRRGLRKFARPVECHRLAGGLWPGGNAKSPPRENPRRAFKQKHRDEEISVLGRPGSDLLFQALRLSTIGAVEFNGRVRDGNGFRLH